MDITKFVKDKMELWERGSVQITEGLTFNAHQTIKKIIYYTESKYESGQKDRRGKLKPFFNIVNFRVNVATRATDLDTKDIQIVADEPQFMPMSFLLQKEVYNWMKDANFAKTLNEMGATRAKFGGVLVKKCLEQEEGEEEELELEVVDWRNVIVDPSNPDNMVIEKHYLIENELAEKDGVWEEVREAIDVVRKSAEKKLEVFEVTAELPESYAPEGGDEYTYRIQKFFLYNKTRSGKSVILYHEFLDEFPYKYLPWEKINGRLGRGIVEDGFEAQQWTNDAVIKEKEAMELGSKVIFKSTDPTIQNNILSEVENGQIIKIAPNTDLAIANTITNNLPEFRQLIQSWDSQLEKTTSTFNAVTGETMPSGTAYRTTAILNQEATSMFDYRREEMGIFLVEIFTDWIIPYLLKKFNKAHILAAEFTPEELKMIDDSFSNYQANQKMKESILSGKPVYAEDYVKMVQETKDLLMKSKDKRFLDIPKGQYKNWKPKVTILTTGEQKNKAVILESLNNVLMTAAKAPQVLTDPTLSKVFAKILEVSGSGISPISLGMGQTMTQSTDPAPAPTMPELPVSPAQPAQ